MISALSERVQPSDYHEPWFTREEAAQYLGCHVNTVDKHRKEGRLRPIYVHSRKPVYPLSELERFAREQQNQPPLGPVAMPPAPDPRPRRRADPWNAPKK